MKINVTNAFDIDMIGCFYSWLKKKKSSMFKDDNDFTTFQEISEHIETLTKVYACRVDNLTEATSKLVEQFKSNNPNNSTTKIDDDNNATTIQKSKRHKIMLTTPEKLMRCKPNKDTFIPALINHKISSFNHNELISTSRPSSHFLSMYYNKSLAEELKTSSDINNKKEENNEKIEIDESFFHMKDIISKGAICPEFNGFVAERDKVENSDDDQLNGIEYHFDPNNHQFLNNPEDSICDEAANNKLDSSSNDKDITALDGLLKCIDNVNREYSFFNPKLLANLNEPTKAHAKAWKAQAMAKALKSHTPSKRKDIIPNNSNINGNTDKSTQQNIKKLKTFKKRNQVKNDSAKINWLNKSQIDEIFKNKIQDKKYISSHELQKWNPLDNISVTHSIVADITYKFNFLKYSEIKPDWWICNKNIDEDSGSETSNSYQNNNDCSQDTSEPMEIDYEVSENLESKNFEKIDDKLANLNALGELKPEDENVIIDIESKIDIGELNKEISDIIDEQCVEINSKSEWSSKLSFFNLLKLLRVNERDCLSIPMVFVSLLHLANEKGLKLFQEHCIVNDMEETFIAKPMNKD